MTQHIRFGYALALRDILLSQNVVYSENVRQCENNHAVKDMKLLKNSVRNLILFSNSR